ncbi:MAG TPA: FtsX-like permease family protein [Aquihabitans sp.]|nr:FtsX-like permease family protein [Aquihabitans sp.]
MNVVAPLAALLWRRGGLRQRATLVLTAAGVSASVVLTLLVLSVGPALDARADRIAWRDPARSDATTRDLVPTAVQRTLVDRYEGRMISRTDLAPLRAGGGSSTGAPPGLSRFPAAGEVFVSPAMGRLLAATHPAVLGDRYPGRLAGTIGPAGLAHAEELVVVVGHPGGALGHPTLLDDITAGTWPILPGEAAPIATFSTIGGDADLDRYRTLARTAAVLLAVPALLLVGAAARLTAAQREQRLAVLRLVGATPGAAVGLTALETAVAALVGTVVAIGGYLAVLPHAARIPLAGGAFPVDDLRLGPDPLVAAGVLVPLLATAAAVLALRQVVIGPLGVARRTRRGRPAALRLAVVPPTWAVFVLAARDMRGGGSSTGVLVGLAAVIATLAVVGPWVTWVLGSGLAAVARRPAPLLAGRRIADDPKGAYRTVSGMVLSGLIAGFLFGVVPTISAVSLEGTDSREYTAYVPEADVAAVERQLAVVDPRAVITTVSSAEPDDLDPDLDLDAGARADAADPGEEPPPASVTVSATEAGAERVRTILARIDPELEVSGRDGDGRARTLLDDLRRASVVLALASLAMAVAATAISGISSILDQRTTLARLRLVGTPLAVLQRARRWQTSLPLVVASVGAMAAGAAAGLVMLVAFAVAPSRIVAPDVGGMAVLGAAALVAAVLVVGLTRPVLAATSRSTPRD